MPASSRAVMIIGGESQIKHILKGNLDHYYMWSTY